MATPELQQGTLDLLILTTLNGGALHGWVLPLATRVPAVRRRLLSVLVARFA